MVIFGTQTGAAVVVQARLDAAVLCVMHEAREAVAGGLLPLVARGHDDGGDVVGLALVDRALLVLPSGIAQVLRKLQVDVVANGLEKLNISLHCGIRSTMAGRSKK